MIYRNSLIEKEFDVDENNYFEARFLLEIELSRIKKRLEKLRRVGIIKTTNKNAKIKDSRFKEQVTGMFMSRTSIKELLVKIETFK